MARPVIGISCYVEPASWGVWRDVPAALVPKGYVDHVQRAGGRAVILPPLSSTEAPEPAGAALLSQSGTEVSGSSGDASRSRLERPGAVADPLSDGALEAVGLVAQLEESAEETAALLSRLDGLIIAGGVDVEPSRYGADAHPSIQAARRDRDASELLMVTCALAADLPLLGICRGMQVMAVEAGGTLEQHIPDRVGNPDHSPAPGVYGDHPVDVLGGTLLRTILGERVDVPSYHHQAVETHPGYEATAYAPDGTLEAMERRDRQFCLAVQWHPEAGTDNRLFQALISAC